MKKHHPVILIILDGFGYRTETADNAIAAAKTPTWDALWGSYPHTLLSGSGLSVGLPEDQMGNSEVGHLNMGAGRIIYQELTRIDKAITDGSFFHNNTLIEAVKKAKSKGSAIHLMGLLSSGGVHSHEKHLHALLDLIALQDYKNVFCHLFLDGRDTPPKSALSSLDSLETHLHKINCGVIASISGRYFAMDRDQRWERIQTVYELLTSGKSNYHVENAQAGLREAYARGETDEFVTPTAICASNALPVAIKDGDVVIFTNYRADRARELTRAFVETDFQGFKRTFIPHLTEFVTFTEYEANLKTAIAFPPDRPKNVLGEYVSNLGLQQLRIAETEKYAHVTFFFNGGNEEPFLGEERILIPSPKISTYDLQPEMSALQLTQSLKNAIESQKYDLIICNYANPDMVGHTGNFPATVQAIEVIDNCLNTIVTAAKALNYEVLITADHGNAEKMFDSVTNQPHTAHTSDPVPLLYIGRPATITRDIDGSLADVAPTILYLMGLPIPVEMTGKPLLKLV